jgi:hypothetical protein
MDLECPREFPIPIDRKWQIAIPGFEFLCQTNGFLVTGYKVDIARGRKLFVQEDALDADQIIDQGFRFVAI